MLVDWADRAAVAERVITRRYLRRLAGLVPGTRIGRVRWPRPIPERPWPWHYWWQAHLLDCLVDAQLREPSPARASTVAALARTILWRNLGSWTNSYYDDIAWLGLAVHRAGALARRSTHPALAAITAQLVDGWTAHGGGGIWWRRGDNFKNAPTNGPAAILLARTGKIPLAAAITDWMAETLIDPDWGLVRDGVRVDENGVCEVVPVIYTYCQGVYLGACVELAQRDGYQRWLDRAVAVLDAVSSRLAGPDGVIPGHDDGGDGGLFNGILARYLALAAREQPALAPAAARIVLASADAAWRARTEVNGGPVFAQDWRCPATNSRPTVAGRDLSVQLSAWMLFEAAAVVQHAR